MTKPVVRRNVLAIDAYVPGKSAAPGAARVFKLSANETPLGPSPTADRGAARARAEDRRLSRRLGDAACGRRSARRMGSIRERIVCGAGSDDILALLAHAFVGRATRGSTRNMAFSNIASSFSPPAAFRSSRRRRITASSVDAILAKVTERTKIVFLANPNNPTGTYLPKSEILRLADALPPHVAARHRRRLCGICAAPRIIPPALELAATRDNVVTTRTFSKIYGLAGLRLGWGYGPAPVVDALNRLRGPFNVSSAAIEAGIEAVRGQSASRGGDRA